MSRGLATVDRIIVLLVGLLALAGGAWFLALHYNCPPAQEWNQKIDSAAIGRVPENNWYLYLLIGIVVLSAIIGLWLIIANIRPRGFSRVKSSASTSEGTIGLNISKIAEAISRTVEHKISRVESVNEKVAFDRNRPTVRWTINAQPGIRIDELAAVLEQSEQDFREAIRDIDVDTTYRLHVQPVER
ncbi:alkaline shock response membrane anchor protein AmaP [Corynebacterium poyangense]|uniref:Alkaline shock response membrane anchor protein AmaP n=1 Tax=Corynebacterium poyangense TaxID=2684405 RepID=A0A7H0SM10_9CORY|nr:alkaline shock response membrane anchor protein AmaP [Corynebacterium poyangense]MBZ8177696.1 alkaline shock response membrane anchor protein AmaP [Corynebacterium poyangense]QNQ89585.1 alkaline shock response membrane anchor protein AmaP [Corynebacterium poyangense]